MQVYVSHVEGRSDSSDLSDDLTDDDLSDDDVTDLLSSGHLTLQMVSAGRYSSGGHSILIPSDFD